MSLRGDITRNNIMEVIEKYTLKNGFSPTLREIGDLVGISISTVHVHLQKLKKQGEIEWNPTQPRTIRRAS